MKKICTKCKEQKEETEFSFRNKEKGIRQFNCKACQKIMKDSHYINNKEKYLVNSKKGKQKYIQWWYEFKKQLHCEMCGENHIAVLDFHHIDSVDKHFNIGSAVGNRISKKRLLDEIQKCKVLCSNCHRKIHWEKSNLVPLV